MTDSVYIGETLIALKWEEWPTQCERSKRKPKWRKDCKESEEISIRHTIHRDKRRVQMKHTCQICILIRTAYFGPLRWLRAKPDSNVRSWTQTLHVSLEEVTFPSYCILLCEGRPVPLHVDKHWCCSFKIEVIGHFYCSRRVGSSLIPLLCLWMCLKSLTLLLQQLQDYAFPARQILLLPLAIEDIDLCMEESYTCHIIFVEFLCKATRTGIYYICLAPTEWAFTSTTDQFLLSRGVTTYFLWSAAHTYFSCELPTKLTGTHIIVVNLLQCDCMKAQSVTEFLKEFLKFLIYFYKI